MTSRLEEEMSSLVVQGWMNVWGMFCHLFTVANGYGVTGSVCHGVVKCERAK